ncbi:MAG TPA: 2-phospho-L-lactate transferase [Anaerolineales bacterium]|nr:2-phospho-L-lactate transferase [Anaerolineales bacterium]
MKVVALAGGVGGAKLVDGLARNLPPEDLTVIVNTGDDFEHLGLKICPDLDTVCYTLAGSANPATGWGRANETWNALQSLAELGGPVWFRLGDRDLGTHLERTRLIHEGNTLSQVTRRFCEAWGVGPAVLPMSDAPVPTLVYTDEGELHFQEYFVRRQCRPRVTGFEFQRAEQALPAPGVLEALNEARLIVICPSNPWVSIDPILAILGNQSRWVAKEPLGREPGTFVPATAKGCPVVAVSPIIGGEAVRGPAAKMYAELGVQPSALAVAGHYGSAGETGLLSGFVLDHVDKTQADEVRSLGIEALVTNTLMHTPAERTQLAKEVLLFAGKLLN